MSTEGKAFPADHLSEDYMMDSQEVHQKAESEYAPFGLSSWPKAGLG